MSKFSLKLRGSDEDVMPLCKRLIIKDGIMSCDGEKDILSRIINLNLRHHFKSGRVSIYKEDFAMRVKGNDM